MTRKRRVLSLCHVFKVYERGSISVKMVYNRVLGVKALDGGSPYKTFLNTFPPPGGGEMTPEMLTPLALAPTHLPMQDLAYGPAQCLPIRLPLHYRSAH